MTPKERMAIPPQEMPQQDPKVRAHNMDEVALGYTAEMAKTEASRCMQCPTKPCMHGLVGHWRQRDASVFAISAV